MHLDLRAVAAHARRAETEELLDRVTVYRDGMEPAAVDLMEGELARRGVSPEEVAAHDQRRRAAAIFLADGIAMNCTYCDRPAVARAWRWHKLWGWLPVFPRRVACCEVHDPQPSDDE